MIKRLTYSCLCLLLALAGCKSGMPSLRETYSQKDTEPFGTYVMYNQLKQLYSNNSIRTAKSNFLTFWNDNSDTGALYILTSKRLFATPNEGKAMLSFAEKGNTIFLNCEYLDTAILKTLGCSLGGRGLFQLDDYRMKNTSVKLNPELGKELPSFNYFYYPFNNYFSAIDSAYTKVLGTNDAGKPNFIVCFYGRGRVYLHCEPRALGNYFLLQRDNYKYLQQLFSFTSTAPEHVFWDDYYWRQNRTRSDGDGSSSGEQKGIGVLLQYPAMKWAFWILFALLILYILFGGKRRQRIVPVIEPTKNTSIAFTETIARLYLQQKDNRNIADKIITYFFESIRNQYYLNTNHLNEEFMLNLSRKSDFALEEVQQLFRQIRQVQESADLSDNDLLLLNQRIENFIKNRT